MEIDFSIKRSFEEVSRFDRNVLKRFSVYTGEKARKHRFCISKKMNSNAADFCQLFILANTRSCVYYEL